LPAVTDSAEVVIPISTKVYEDSLYRAVISGYNVSLDTMQIYRNTVYVDHFREVTKMVRPGRWSVGLQVGYGTDFRGMRPYLGVGVSYKLFDF
jgi:opacity protein-like surface antigen